MEAVVSRLDHVNVAELARGGELDHHVGDCRFNPRSRVGPPLRQNLNGPIGTAAEREIEVQRFLKEGSGPVGRRLVSESPFDLR